MSTPYDPPPTCPTADCYSCSFSGPMKTLGETARAVEDCLPLVEHDGDVRKYRATYIIHTRTDAAPCERDVQSDESNAPRDATSSVIGQIKATKPGVYGAPFPDHLAAPEQGASAGKTLTLEVGYCLLPKAWGKGFAAEALAALVEAFRSTPALWAPPYERVFLQAVMGEANRASRRVVEKAGFERLGVHRWDGPDVFVGGAMQPAEVLVYGRYADSAL